MVRSSDGVEGKVNVEVEGLRVQSRWGVSHALHSDNCKVDVESREVLDLEPQDSHSV